MTEKQKIRQQDFVDNVIQDMLNSLNPAQEKLHWNIKPISEIRQIVQHYFVEELCLCKDTEFYP